MEVENNIVQTITVPKQYITLMLNMINIMSKRGAFVPEDFSSIGELHDFLKKELSSESK